MDLRPLTFAGCFGWLHQAAPGPLGVVMCASWEYEASATRQTWRVFADRLAEAGMPTLRYDYPGCGDSLGLGNGSGAFEAMLKSIGAACEALRESAGVTRIALVGLRLGASMAQIAAETLDVEALVLVRPILRGKIYLAEQRALARLVQTREARQVRRDADLGALEVEGFRLGPELADRIARIDLSAADRPSPKRLLIVAEPGSAQYEDWRERLAARGAIVERLDLVEVGGWAPAPVPVPPPLADCDAIGSWLKSVAMPLASRSDAAMLRGDRGLETATFRETAMTFGPGLALAGVLCRPRLAPTEAPRRAVLFLNTGANSHVGAGRAAVVYARALAERGVASLRMDIVGLGDAAWTKEGPLSAIHRAERVADVIAAIDELRAQQFEEISLVGVCSGAFLAFQSALADARINRILLANPQFWLPPAPESLADPLKGAYGSTSAYLTKLLKPATWRRALNGEFKLSTLKGIAAEIWGRAASRALGLLERAKPRMFRNAPDQGPLVSQLRELKGRGCGVQLLLSEGDPARETLAALLPGGAMALLDGLMRIVVVEGADHAFVMRRTREEFFALLCDFLDAPRSVGARRKPPARDKAA